MEDLQKDRPSIFEYDNYRDFLKKFYDWKKSQSRAFSFRFFSRAAGFSSPNFLKLVMEGKRNISAPSIDRFSQALKLTRGESQFFSNLVQMNQAKTVEEKRQFAEQIVRSRIYKKFYPLRQAQYNYYAQWYFIPIREMVGLPGFVEDAPWIARTIIPNITASEAKNALEELESIGLIGRNPEGKLVQTDALVTTGDEVSVTSVAQFHREMMKKASESIDLFTKDLREISSVTMWLSTEAAQKIKGLISKFRKEVLSISNRDLNPDRVYQFNSQFFPLSAEVPVPEEAKIQMIPVAKVEGET